MGRHYGNSVPKNNVQLFTGKKEGKEGFEGNTINKSAYVKYIPLTK
jgi:hypothetical protein